jgi:hypothetical protein
MTHVAGRIPDRHLEVLEETLVRHAHEAGVRCKTADFSIEVGRCNAWDSN